MDDRESIFWILSSISSLSLGSPLDKSINIPTTCISVCIMCTILSQKKYLFFLTEHKKYLHACFVPFRYKTIIILFQSSWICPLINWRYTKKKKTDLQNRRQKCVLFIMMINHNNKTSRVSTATHTHTFTWYIHTLTHTYTVYASFVWCNNPHH